MKCYTILKTIPLKKFKVNFPVHIMIESLLLRISCWVFGHHFVICEDAHKKYKVCSICDKEESL
jgi:hypothetical protein